MRIFKNNFFDKWARSIDLKDKTLKTAVDEIAAGLYDANLGGCLFKKRIGLKGKGKSGGIRTIIAFKKEDKAFFIYGFAKNEKANINPTFRTTDHKKINIIYMSDYNAGGANGCDETTPFFAAGDALPLSFSASFLALLPNRLDV